MLTILNSSLLSKAVHLGENLVRVDCYTLLYYYSLSTINLQWPMMLFFSFLITISRTVLYPSWNKRAITFSKPQAWERQRLVLSCVLPVHMFVCNLFQSSLLSAVLRELPPSQGLVSVHGRIAYVSQQPWVFSGTVRSNILFGKKYEKERYEQVIKACALKKVSDDF